MNLKQTLYFIFLCSILQCSISVVFSSQLLKNEETFFSHSDHKSEASCRDCHLMYQNQNKHFPDKEKCLECHDDDSIDFKIHTKFRKNKFSHFIHKDKQCSQCHNLETEKLPTVPKAKDCKICHKRQKPKWHTGFFRIRGHGIQAEINREKCITCHQSTFCIRCHQSTRPLNHRGNWSTLHGKAVVGGYSGKIGKCATCHTYSCCAQCHNRKLK